MGFFDDKTDEEVYRIVSGRRRYQAARGRMKEARKLRLVQLISSGKYEPRNTTKLAEELGVSRMTVHNYIKEIEEEDGRCVRCGQLLPHMAIFAD